MPLPPACKYGRRSGRRRFKSLADLVVDRRTGDGNGNGNANGKDNDDGKKGVEESDQERYDREQRELSDRRRRDETAERCSGKQMSSPLVQECSKGQLMEGWRFNVRGFCTRHSYKCGFATKEERFYLWETREECLKSRLWLH